TRGSDTRSPWPSSSSRSARSRPTFRSRPPASRSGSPPASPSRSASRSGPCAASSARRTIATPSGSRRSSLAGRRRACLPARRDELAPGAVVGTAARRHVEAEPVDQPAVLLLEEPRHLGVRALDREDLEHLVRDERRHACPVALRRLLVQPVAGLAPALRLEHGDVGARGGVEGDLLPDPGAGAVNLLAVLAGDDERAGRERHILPLAVRLLQA